MLRQREDSFQAINGDGMLSLIDWLYLFWDIGLGYLCMNFLTIYGGFSSQ